MKKKVMSMLLTGMLAVSVLAGCGSNGAANSGTTSDAGSSNQVAADNNDAGDAGNTQAASEAGSTQAASEAAGDFDADEFISVISREDGSGTRGAFIELFGVEQKDADGNKVDNTTEEAIITNNTEVMLTTVAGSEYAIGYVSLGSLNDSVKAVSIDGVEPSVEGIKDGSYAIARPFNIATKDGLSDVAQDFVNFIMSADGQSIIEGKGYIPVNDAAEAFESNGAEGKVVVAGSSSVTPVMEKLQEAYLAINPNANIEIQQSDSSTGMTAAADGTCDIGMASRELKDSELEAGLTPTVIAMDGIAVIVNQDNPTENLTSEQVMNIYTGEVTTWSEVQ